MSSNIASNDQTDLASQVEATKNNAIGEKTVKMYLRRIVLLQYDLDAADDFEKFSMLFSTIIGGQTNRYINESVCNDHQLDPTTDEESGAPFNGHAVSPTIAASNPPLAQPPCSR
ncbi:hypothetical protein JG688_00012828 [Phytophthora aleatoria]|uniref:Uncharacterized protein n=1 Tax=Phytophthora aleatoria TaxID=2496075 RepID=A0A8J5IMR4_9STRA|nr:hypothetical protein JG688_00012828 [Phytophthora aleatoria]